MHRALSAVALALVFVGCGTPAMTSSPPSTPDVPKGAAAQSAFDRALASFIAHDAAHDWNDASCKEVAGQFEAIGTPPALHDAALAYQRCGLVGDGIRVLEKSVTEAKFQDAPALVTLAKLQMAKDGATPEAKLNLQRALAIDDNSMAAYDQLAVWYLTAKKLDLAALVCSQAIKKHATYAPIHVTLGLVENALGRVNAALAAFAEARRLDPKLFDAHMSYALVNLGFRGWEQAREGFTRALALHPNDYDAHLGLALALRGPITGAENDLEARIAAVQSELDACKRIDPNRPDAWFNEGILTQEFRTKTTSDRAKTKVVLDEAERTFKTFLAKATGKARYDVAVQRANGRLEDIDAMRKFL